jgi:excinuclease ABC subunit C
MNLTGVKKLNIPTTPGSYQYYDKAGKIIYIGKAANLRSRVLSYWRPSADHTPAKEKMVTEIAKIKWLETDTEIEALLLEANLVKKYQPEYNVLLRDDKRYSYIKVSTEEKWPRVFVTREIEKSGRYFGPFTSTGAARETVKILRKIWPFYIYPYSENTKSVSSRMNRYMGIYEYPADNGEYRKSIDEIIKFLEGKKKSVEKNIELRIKNYELRAKKETDENKQHDLIEKIHQEKFRQQNLKQVLAHANLLSVGEKYAADVIELAKTLSLPKAPERIEGYDIYNTFGQESVGSMVVFKGGEPDKSQYRKFKIKNNVIARSPEVSGRRSNPTDGNINEIASSRGLGTRNDKGGGDTGMLREILERRFHNDWPLPDLMIIDGGKGQLNACLSILKKLKLEIPIIAISKGEGLRSAHAPDKIFFPGARTPLQLPLASPALHIIKRVRDEAHRFAITFHRQRRSKNWLNQ